MVKPNRPQKYIFSKSDSDSDSSDEISESVMSKTKSKSSSRKSQIKAKAKSESESESETDEPQSESLESIMKHSHKKSVNKVQTKAAGSKTKATRRVVTRATKPKITKSDSDSESESESEKKPPKKAGSKTKITTRNLDSDSDERVPSRKVIKKPVKTKITTRNLDSDSESEKKTSKKKAVICRKSSSSSSSSSGSEPKSKSKVKTKSKSIRPILNSNMEIDIDDEFQLGGEDSDSDTSYDEAVKSELQLPKSKTIGTTNPKLIDIRLAQIVGALRNIEIKPLIDINDSNAKRATSSGLSKKVLDANVIFSQMKVTLVYIKSGTTGHTFCATSIANPNIRFAIKVCAFPKDDYGYVTNPSRPENVELRILKLLSNFVIFRKTPHLVLPICAFNTKISHFTKMPENINELNDDKGESYKEFLDRYRAGEFHPVVSVLISEWCDGGDLLDYIRNNYKTMTIRMWTVIFFQILYTLARIHMEHPSFRHNDLKANNILLQKIQNEEQSIRYNYKIGNKSFMIPSIGFQSKIWDFDFACIGGYIENNKVNASWTRRISITRDRNKYYDIHYFFNSLSSRRFFRHFHTGGAPQEIVEFVKRVVPEGYRSVPKQPGKQRVSNKFVNHKGRLRVNIEYTTPYKIIMEDPLFENYRFPIIKDD